MCMLERFVGPRVPLEELRAHRARYAIPSILLSLARILLLVSVFLPYWRMELVAPQYPEGLHLTAYVNHLTGDVREIDGLNHYIGMKPLDEAAKLERASGVWLIVAMVLMVEMAAFVHNKFAVLFAVPAATFPAVFLIDLAYWLRAFGRNLDPHAPLSNSVKPFTPTVLGEGGIGQFKTFSEVGPGLWLAIAGAAVIVVAFFFHRRAYKPLAERMAKGGTGCSS